MNPHLPAALLLATGLLLPAAPTHAKELATTSVPQAELPKGVEVQGRFVAAVAWADRTGPNIAVFCEEKLRGSVGANATLYATGYRLAGKKMKPIWDVWDSVDACQLDLTSHFEPKSIEVTDLDDNGMGEVSFVYRMACNGGMDLVEEKLFLVQNGHKYPIRGGTQLTGQSANGSGGFYDGPMKVGQAYRTAPRSFKAFAVDKWRKFRRPSGG